VAALDLVIGDDQTTAQPQVDGVVAASLVPASRWADGLDAFLRQACAGLDPCEVFYLAGVESFPIDQLGLAAVQEAASASASIELAGHAEAFYDTATASAVMAQALADHPGIDLVIASGDQMALGAEQAAAQAGLSPRIVGAGAGASSLDAVRAGRWLATFTTLPRTEGTIATRLLVRALRNRTAEPVGVDPVEASGLPVWWTAEALAEQPDFTGEWPGP
jgi:ABC-type sugar transport system substrate-binding protein